MSFEKFEDECAGCVPAILDVKTGKPLGPDAPAMQAVMAAWKSTTRQDREAFHRVMCQHSRADDDLKVVATLVSAIQSSTNGTEPPT